WLDCQFLTLLFSLHNKSYQRFLLIEKQKSQAYPCRLKLVDNDIHSHIQSPLENEQYEKRTPFPHNQHDRHFHMRQFEFYGISYSLVCDVYPVSHKRETTAKALQEYHRFPCAYN